jgi:ankyrin repeat protein
MERTEDKRKLNRELIRECGGYTIGNNKPDGAYIRVLGHFFNINKIRRLIERGANLRAKDKWGYTPLHRAVERDYKELAKLLIGSGADVMAKNKDGETPLHRAVRWANIEVAKFLIDSGADVNAKGYLDRTPLFWAVDGYYTEIAKLLIDSGADVNAKDYDGYTPLDLAYYQKMKDFLIEHGAKK